MTKNGFLTLSVALFLSSTYGQDSIYLKQNAIKIDRPDSLNDDIYKAISNYQLLMIGENHGSNEPAKFVLSLATLLISKGDNVQIGLEIPSEQMKQYLACPTNENIYTSDFFAKKNYTMYDLRTSFAWADLIAKLNCINSVEIFFYDANLGDSKNYNDRDSLMYLKIKKRIQRHPTWKTITLGGNIHNMLVPYMGKEKMALYLRSDNDLGISSKILSLDHLYSTGTIRVNTGNGLQLNQVDRSDTFFAKTLDYDCYLALCKQSIILAYNAIYFTRKITASKLVVEK